MILQMEPSACIPRGEADYENPYMVEDKDDDILARLRRDTTNDRRNKKNYKREVLSLDQNDSNVKIFVRLGNTSLSATPPETKQLKWTSG